MKPLMCLLLCWWITSAIYGQNPTLAISTDKTTSLIFPYPIKHVDRGTGDVLVQPVKGAEHILLIKAACRDFPETNLSVVTGDGSLFSFLVTYQKTPSVLTYELPAGAIPPLASYAARLMDNPRMLHGVRDHKWGMTATLQGLYIKDGTMYYQLCLDNETPIDYEIDYLRFLVRDRKRSKRTAIQEAELKPLHVAGNITGVKAFAREVLVIALEKFTLPDAKYFAIEIGEKSGGRHLALRVGNGKIVKAISIEL
jgi:hypothetical protein